MKIDILDNKHPLKKLAIKVLKILKVSGTPEIFFVSSREMRSLKRKYLGKDEDTNVLAFPYPAIFPQVQREKQLGEIYLSPSYIKRHKESIEYMLIHGLLHLLGFNHEVKNDRMQMEKLESRLMDSLNSNNQAPNSKQ